MWNVGGGRWCKYDLDGGGIKGCGEVWMWREVVDEWMDVVWRDVGYGWREVVVLRGVV